MMSEDIDLQAAVPRRLLIGLFVAMSLGACSTNRIDLGQCWSPTELKQGASINGQAVFMVGPDTRPLMSPIGCEGTSVIANIPDGSLGYDPAKEIDETEPVFFRAKVEGVVDGTAEGRPMLTLEKVEDVAQFRPTWWKIG